MYLRILTGLLLFLSTPLAAHAAEPSPYQGQEQRPIKALSSSEIQNYLQGAGMGFAKAAELNHYPGPKHVLELASDLELSSEQLSQTQALFTAMQKQAITLGKAYVAQEKALERTFTEDSITPQQLKQLLQKLGTIRAQIREVHLLAHIKQRQILSAEQVALYDQLRHYQHNAHATPSSHQRHTTNP